MGFDCLFGNLLSLLFCCFACGSYILWQWNHKFFFFVFLLFLSKQAETFSIERISLCWSFRLCPFHWRTQINFLLKASVPKSFITEELTRKKPNNQPKDNKQSNWPLDLKLFEAHKTQIVPKLKELSFLQHQQEPNQCFYQVTLRKYEVNKRILKKIFHRYNISLKNTNKNHWKTIKIILC